MSHHLTSSCFLSGAVFTLGMCVLDADADFGAFLRGLPPPGLREQRLHCMDLMVVLYSITQRTQQVQIPFSGDQGRVLFHPESLSFFARDKVVLCSNLRMN